MNQNALRLFSEVASKLSFATVAHDRNMDPSSVSRSISQLESELGIRLLHRTTRAMSLTEAGTRFYHQINSILDDYDMALEEARNIAVQPQGTLRLTASIAFGEHMIIPVLPAFQKQYPNIKLELLFTDSNLDLVEDRIDVAIRLGPQLSGDFIVTQLFPTKYHVCATPEYLHHHSSIEKPEDLQHHNCLRFTLNSFRNNWHFKHTKTDQKTHLPIDGNCCVSSALSLKSLVLRNQGVGLLADWLIRDEIQHGQLTQLLPQYQVTATDFETAAWIVFPSRTYVPNKTRVMIDFLKSHLSGNLYKAL
ncbi:LysR family transcriptional regulator [Marinicella sp. W31]|uniref:LysR family transcriptional regulator n=1 Tax=Marinicella sp. W31 TaxID=3023713 RepID=UPI003757E7F1